MYSSSGTGRKFVWYSAACTKDWLQKQFDETIKCTIILRKTYNTARVAEKQVLEKVGANKHPVRYRSTIKS
jgi:hypothetical protein